VNIKKNILYRVYACFACMVIFGFAILGKAYKIQTVDNGYWASISDSLSTDLKSIPAERGNIYSADGGLLATSLPYFELRMDLASSAMTDEIFNENVDGLARKMASKFGQKSHLEYKRDLIRARQQGNRYYLIKRKVDYTELSEIKTWPLFKEGKFAGGLIVITKQTRKLPYGELASRTIGYVRENAQSIGLEAEYEPYLAGKEGTRLMQRIAGGTWVPLTDENAIDPQNGKDIYTTIDINLQDLAEAALMKAVVTNKAKSGCVIVMEVKTGAIKAIANLGMKGDGTYGEIYNYAIGKRTEPGSTFKAASMLALLEDGHITPDDSVNINHGSGKFYTRSMHDAGGWNKYETIPAWKVFAISSNVGMGKFAEKYYKNDRQKFYQKLEQFHLTEKTGIPIKGEAAPLIKRYDDPAWSNTTIPWIATGYEIEVTPLQTLTFYNAIANGGKMVKPYLVDRVMENGKEIMKYKTDVLDNRISTDTAIQMLTGMMVKVVEEGTAKNIKSEYYSIAGKSGTAKILDPVHGYVNRYRASFAGFFPAEVPQYSIMVLIEEPSAGLSHGGSVAAPVFKEISDKIMSVNLKNIQPFNMETDTPSVFLVDTRFKTSVKTYNTLAKNLNLKMDQYGNANYIDTQIDTSGKATLKPIVMKSKSIPDVSGLALDEALFILENIGLKVHFSGRGKVKGQSLQPGTAIKNNMVIQLQLG
jgi:cell division protein FtsI (penicillin-binding protein 3)